MSDELVKRLRDLADRFGKCRDSDTVQEAVDRIQDLIQALQAQNLRLSGMVYDLKKEVAVGEAEASLALLERAEKAEAERDRLRAALIEERTETLWNAYNTGMERDGRWRHMCMSDGEWLERECGLAVIQPDHPADVVKAAIPFAAKRFVAAKIALKGESHE